MQNPDINGTNRPATDPKYNFKIVSRKSDPAYIVDVTAGDHP